jgi:hypothetical protein
MAKSKAQPAAAPARTQARPRRGHQADAERWSRLLIVGGVIAVIVIAIGVIVYGWYQTQIKPLGKTILTVGDTEFSLGHLERRMRQNLEGNSTFFRQNPLSLSRVTLDELEREGRFLEGAQLLNIFVTDEEVAAEIRTRGGLSEDVEADVYAAEFRQQVEDSGLHEGEFVQQVRAGLLQQKVRDYFTFLAPATEPQIRARYIILDDEEKANEALQRLQAGADFNTVALELGSGATGEPVGDIDWSPRGASQLLPDEAERFLFEEAQPNQISEVFEFSGTFYIAQLLERDEQRPLDDTGRQIVAGREMQDWLDGLTIRVERSFSDEDENKALTDVF